MRDIKRNVDRWRGEREKRNKESEGEHRGKETHIERNGSKRNR